MTDFFDQVGKPNLPPSPGGAQPSSGDFFSQISGGQQPTTQLDQQSSWWDQYGRIAEGAAAAGLALAFGPKLARGAGAVGRAMGPIGEAARTGVKNIQSILAPSTVDEAAGRAAAVTREESGLAAQQTAQAKAALDPFWSKIGGAPESAQKEFINYVETRSKGTQLRDPSLQPLADEMRRLVDEVHQDAGQINQSQKFGFIQDYYRHQWVVDENSNRIFSKEGNRSFTKERRIPTIQEGINLGLTPRTLDPVQTTLEYITSARRFIAANKILDEGQKAGDVFFKPLGSKQKFPTDDNWVPIEGALGKRGGGQLYAKEGWARVYNNWRSPGFTGAAGDVMQALRHTSNTITGLELGLSGFHFTTMVNEAIINDVAKAITAGAGGDIGEALKGFAKAPTAPYRLAKIGSELQNVYLGKNRGTQEMREMSDLLTSAGGRAQGMLHAKDYEYTAMGSFFDSWKRGALSAEMGKLGENIVQAPITGTAKAVASLVGRTMQTIAQPLFNYYIPRLKNGAFYDTMGQWLKENPGASRADKVAQARVVWDSIDNRFGELVQDNIFWKQHMKQTSMLGMRSYSWNLGTMREIGGGIKDISQHEFTPRAAYVLALPLVYGTMSAIYQVLKTGEQPRDMHDLVAPRTGGTDPATGLPERMIMPGYMKDVFGWYQDPAAVAAHKLSTFITTGGELVTGKDWRGAPIAPPAQDPNAPLEQTAPEWLKAYMLHVGSKFLPISAKDLYQGARIGSNLSTAERLGLGLQPAGRRYVAPEATQAYERYRKLKDWQKKQGFESRQQSYYGGTE